MDRWQGKLDGQLQDLVGSSRPVQSRVDCLVRIDDASLTVVDDLVDSLGGVVRHRIHIVPGLTVSLPLHAVSALASSPHVVGIEAERVYTTH